MKMRGEGIDSILRARASFRSSRAAWRALLARGRVVLTCFCVDPRRCHRTVLAWIQVKLGATFEGELREARASGIGRVPARRGRGVAQVQIPEMLK